MARKEFKIDDFLRDLLNDEYTTCGMLRDYFLFIHKEEVDLLNYDIELLDEQRNITSSLTNAVYILVGVKEGE